MRFRVPQFIDVKDKIFGPLTFVQFVYIVGGIMAIYLLYKILPLWLAIIPIIIVGVLAGLLAFYRINNKPFVDYLKASFLYFTSSKLFIWKQRPAKIADSKEDAKLDINQMTTLVPMISSNKLKDLSWSLDIEEKNTKNK